MTKLGEQLRNWLFRRDGKVSDVESAYTTITYDGCVVWRFGGSLEEI